MDKRMTATEVVAQLRDGMTLGIGGWGPRRKPMALIREIVRSDLKDLTIVAYGGADVGMLCATGKVKKLVEAVEHISFSGPRAIAQGQDITYVTERCVMKLTAEGIVVTEIAPGVDLERDILAQSEFPLLVPKPPRLMDATLFNEALIGLEIPARAA